MPSIEQILHSLNRAEAGADEAIRHLPTSEHPRAVAKLHTALEYIRAAFILVNEGEQARVGHTDDPPRAVS